MQALVTETIHHLGAGGSATSVNTPIRGETERQNFRGWAEL